VADGAEDGLRVAESGLDEEGGGGERQGLMHGREIKGLFIFS
jgi:hypothetical protein